MHGAPRFAEPSGDGSPVRCVVTPGSLPAEPALRAHLAHTRRLRPGLLLHWNDAREETDLIAQTVFDAGLRIVLLLEGAVDVSFGPRQVALSSARGGASAMLVAMTEPEQFTRRARRGYRALQDFFLGIFRGAGEDPASYMLSEALAKSMFDLPLQDAWLYPSTLSEGLNVAFKADNAHDALRLVGVTMGRRDRAVGISAVAFGVPADGGFVWGLMGSLIQRTAFPEFIEAAPN